MKKILTIGLVCAILFPIFKVNVFVEEEGIVSKRKSVIQIIVDDVKDGTLGTGL